MQVKVQHRKDGAQLLAAGGEFYTRKRKLFHPYLEATQLSLSPYVSDDSQITVPLLEPRVSACGESVCAQALLEDTWVSCSLSSHPDGQNPHSFSQPHPVGAPLPGTGTLGWEAQCGAGVPCSLGEGETFMAEISLPSFSHHRCGASPFCVSAPPISFDVASSSNP